MQTLLNAVFQEPEAALDHLFAHAKLARVELALAAQAWRRRALLMATALVLGGLCAGFLGFVLMAWALLPPGWPPLSALQWALLVSPAALCGLGAFACLVAFVRTPEPDPWGQLARQWQLDAGWLLPPRQDIP